jgi:hypothetical protein
VILLPVPRATKSPNREGRTRREVVATKTHSRPSGRALLTTLLTESVCRRKHATCNTPSVFSFRGQTNSPRHRYLGCLASQSALFRRAFHTLKPALRLCQSLIFASARVLKLEFVQGTPESVSICSHCRGSSSRAESTIRGSPSLTGCQRCPCTRRAIVKLSQLARYFCSRPLSCSSPEVWSRASFA